MSVCILYIASGFIYWILEMQPIHFEKYAFMTPLKYLEFGTLEIVSRLVVSNQKCYPNSGTN